MALKSVKDGMGLIRKYPSSLLFMLIISIALFFTSFVMGLLAFLSAIAGTGFNQFFVFAILIGVVATMVLLLLEMGGFPVMVFNYSKRKKSALKDIFGRSFKRIGGLFLASLIIGVIVLLPLVPALAYMLLFRAPATGNFGSSSSIAASILNGLGTTFVLLLLVGLAFTLYLSARFWLSYPILMLENKNATSSIKASWKLSKGKVWSIWATLIMVLILIAVPGTLASVLLGMFPSYSAYVINMVWNIVYSMLAGTFSGVVTTLYYFNLKKK